jgi:hypothetical protein
VGGAGAVGKTLAAWNVLRPPPAMAAGLMLRADAGKGKTVLILGAGAPPTSSTAPAMLEPQRRAGGRSLTLRRGVTFKEMGEAVTAPSRTAAQHQSLLHFVGEGNWSDERVLTKRWCCRRSSGRGRSNDDTGFPKQGGTRSGWRGRIAGNCQVAAIALFNS